MRHLSNWEVTGVNTYTGVEGVNRTRQKEKLGHGVVQLIVWVELHSPKIHMLKSKYPCPENVTLFENRVIVGKIG
jgi:hypothetical protein